ncbi:hypothetical protein [Winogradskya humida]|uniref:Uncharacterized protein n=1 Tax=Winogradskya humida TaxID=113566 RepID=A0ABQ3ZZH6_9ACTN|nr:hypothetical protein [Actinoplanes humidus]GIE23859.1 hypothetical protein Ahu01nite_069610 [Actinoplanes humidus]
MTTAVFPAVTLPACEPGADPSEMAGAVAAWAASPAMRALVAEFGHTAPFDGPVAELLDDLERFSGRRWDYRNGLERQQAVGESFLPSADALIRSAAASLGLAGRHSPPLRKYDHVLVLGGTVRTMVARAEFAARLLRDGVSVSSVVGLGSMRPLNASTDDIRDFGLRDGLTEGDAVDEGLRRAFGLSASPSIRDGVNAVEQPWWIRTYAAASTPIHVLAAPSTDPGRRANTVDTLIGWAGIVEPEPRTRRLLLVTSDLFVPFQHCDAVRILGLGFGCAVDTVGLDTGSSRWVAKPRTFQILQEVRSAVRSMQTLYRSLS